MKCVKAPFTPAQVESLNAYQQQSRLHPYTCGRCADAVLVATAGGWVCRQCDYKQDWCVSMMADWSWKGTTSD